MSKNGKGAMWQIHSILHSPRETEVIPRATLVLRECLFLFLCHLTLDLLTQFPATNDKKYYYLGKMNIRRWSVYLYFLSFEAGIANAFSSYK